MKFRLAMVCLLVALVGCATTGAPNVPGDAVLVPESDARHHFGEVYQGETIDAHFVLYNPAPYRVTIERTEDTCGCTTTVVEGESIGPRSSKSIRVTLDTTQLWGPQSKVVVVHLTDPHRQRVRLVLEGVVRQHLECRPRRLVVTNAASSYAADVAVVNTSDAPLTINGLSVEPATEYLQAHFADRPLPLTLSPGEVAMLRVEAKFKRPGTKLTGHIEFQLAAPHLQLRLPFHLQHPKIGR